MHEPAKTTSPTVWRNWALFILDYTVLTVCLTEDYFREIGFDQSWKHVIVLNIYHSKPLAGVKDLSRYKMAGNSIILLETVLKARIPMSVFDLILESLESIRYSPMIRDV